jgi:hypothetical protein
VDRRISSDGQQLAARLRQADGPSRAGPQEEQQVVSAAQCATRAKAGRGPHLATGRYSFSVFLLQNHSFNCFFVQFILSKFHIVFSIQTFPTKILFREFKSYRNFSIKFKVNEFYSCFRCI